MSKETLCSLIWSSPAGVWARAVELAARSEQPNRRHPIEVGADRSHRARFGDPFYNLPMPTAAAGLVFIGFVLGATVVITAIS